MKRYMEKLLDLISWEMVIGMQIKPNNDHDVISFNRTLDIPSRDWKITSSWE